MANWGGLNNALAAWRTGINALLPNRSTRSDGARADGNHASTSQHQPDPDGTVDAFDEDRNFLGSSDQDGNAAEDRIKAALDLDFMADRRAHLIISDRKIRNSEIGNWRIRDYGGDSPHTEHTHRQVHQSLEDDGRPWKFTRTRAVLNELFPPPKPPVEDPEMELDDVLWDKANPPAWAAPYRELLTVDGVEANPTVRNILMHSMRVAGEARASVAAAKEEILAAIGAAVAELTPPPGGTDAG
jgi:hypothetical protein